MYEALQSVWIEHEPLVLERIVTVERAVDRLIAGRLSDREREQARRAAHMLAGSVGMFGFENSSKAAHALETAFERHDMPDQTRARALLGQLEAMRAEGLEPPRA